MPKARVAFCAALCSLWLGLFYSPAVLAAEDVAGPPAPVKEKRFNNVSVGEMKTLITSYEDTMIKIASDNDLGFNELRSANPDVDPWMPGEGVKMVIPAQHIIPKAERKGIVINLPEMRLYAFLKPGQEPMTVPIGIGREGLSTPAGQTAVRAKKEGPTWRPTPRMRIEKPELPEFIGPGPDNPMGPYALYLGWPEYAIHGTDKPYGIGRRVSSGCIRLYNNDITRLYQMTPVGTPVTVVDQPVKAAWIGGKFYIEAHPTIAQANKIEQKGGFPDYEFSDQDLMFILNAAGAKARDIDWALVRDIVRKRQGYPVMVMKREDKKTSAADYGPFQKQDDKQI